MVIQKRLDYGFNGYQVPVIPRAARSARRSTFGKRTEDRRAFDLLATVADKLLLESGSPPGTSSDASSGKDQSAIVKKEYEDEDNSLNRSQESITSSSLEKVVYEKLRIKSKDEVESSTSKVDEEGSSGYEASGDYKLDGESKMLIKDKLHETKEVLGAEVVLDRKARSPVGSDRDHHVDRFCYPGKRDNANVVGRDDDENSSMTSMRSFRSTPRIGDRRVRKILASKYWTPKRRDDSFFNGGDLKSICRDKRSSLKCHRSQMNIPFKKRKFFPCSSGSNSDGGFNIDGCSNLSEKRVKTDDSVKLRIRSFRVPELFVEISETATIGSLKRTVMEAVTAILGGGLHVGVLLQGKKIRDDDKTLFQTGISGDNELESLGFILEPNSSQTPTSLCHGVSPRMLLPRDSPKPLARYPPGSTVYHSGSGDVLSESREGKLENFIENNRDLALVEKSLMNSRAMVAVPASMTVEALAMVPIHQKSKRSEAVQRRIRRPFSVSEVEALVQAVENLGTGRWRDVKLRAFDGAKHRTYVDLKDKWKTLVHTARISPQQRRGEPVPQELLDRVLTAHSYWSQQQAKHQLKQQQSESLPSLKAF